MTASESGKATEPPSLFLALLGALFLIFGALLCVSAYPHAALTVEWAHATTTTGRVIATEWMQVGGENRLKISYAYKDESDTIYHSTTVLPRKLGKLNPEPRMAIGVLYKPGDHASSKLTIEVGGKQFWPLLCVGALESLVGAGFIYVACRRRRRTGAAMLSAATIAVKNDNTPV